MARILYLNERFWFSSTLTFATLIVSAFSRAISSRSGAINLHGPHHSAQKSTITGLSLRVTSPSKLASSTVIAPVFSIRSRKIIPNLNDQNHGRNTDHSPAKRHRNALHRRRRFARHGQRHARRSRAFRHRHQRLSLLHLDRPRDRFDLRRHRRAHPRG